MSGHLVLFYNVYCHNGVVVYHWEGVVGNFGPKLSKKKTLQKNAILPFRPRQVMESISSHLIKSRPIRNYANSNAE